MEKTPILASPAAPATSTSSHVGRLAAAATVLGLVVLVQHKGTAPATALSLRTTSLGTEAFWMPVAAPAEVKFHQISAGHGRVCATATTGRVYCAAEDDLSAWTPLVGSTQHIELTDSMLFRAATDDSLSYAHASAPTAWSAMYGSNKQLSANGNFVCGIDHQAVAYCLDLANPIAWAVMWANNSDKGTVKQLLLHGDAYFAVNNMDQVYVGKPSAGMVGDEPQATEVAGLFTQLTSNGATLCGVNRQAEIFCADSGLDSTPNWAHVAHVPGDATAVHASTTHLYAINARGALFAHLWN
ncbi:hypothetical protein ACHHYP_17222 [Achlya hypogyna]|uniref:Uncharacterized protein n=1 Tax=Achlya hypogyna TaxID=1202772 RepID=A0A1V9Y4X1_ACHHY|nr:hypothetical protein ACHHYP_17222 [Achlya hypogyna]